MKHGKKKSKVLVEADKNDSHNWNYRQLRTSK